MSRNNKQIIVGITQGDGNGIGYEVIIKALADPRIDTYLRKVEELFGRTSNAEKSGVPRLIHGQRWLVPETDRADVLLELIRQSL